MFNGKPCYLFSYFKGRGEDGLHLAYSHDGLSWDALNGDRSFLQPKVRGGLMRDPFIMQGADGVFHLVWTVKGSAKGFGLAHSRDLVDWSPQTYVPVMEHEEDALNCWAPEIMWDPKREQYAIYWATTIPGRFPATEGTGDYRFNHRIYVTYTDDFSSFSKPELLYDPGFNVIDSTIIRQNGHFVMVLKDETLKPPSKNLRVARASRIAGPWETEERPFTPEGLWVEGPSVLRAGDSYIVYYDCYNQGGYGAMLTRDFREWENISDRLDMPPGARHGSAFRVEPVVLDRLLAYEPAAMLKH